MDVSEEAEDAIRNLTEAQRALVWGFLRQEQVERPKEVVKLRQPMVESLIAVGPKSISEKLDRLLLNLARLSTHGGHEVPLQMEQDFPLGYASNDKEFVFLLRTLAANEQLSADVNKPHLTAKGWARVAELSRTSASLEQAFVAMHLHDSMNQAYTDGFKGGVEDAGYRPYRVDLADFSSKIDDQILAEIKRSRFIVADFSGQRQSVYFEAGYAQGLGLPVFFTCHEDDIEGLHFDTRQYPHIKWKTPEELRKALAAKIQVLVGQGPWRAPKPG